MTTEYDRGRLEAEMRNLKERLDSHEDKTDARMAEYQAQNDARLTKIEGYLQEIRDAANMGKGMFWLLLKIGAVLSAIVAAAVWLWEKLYHVGGFR